MDDQTRNAIEPAAFEPLAPNTAKAPTKRLPRHSWLYALIAVFALAMLFLLTARSLEISVVSESEAQTSLSGLALPFGDRFLVRPGIYSLQADAPGYYPYSDEITVGSDSSQQIEVTLQPLPGLLSVSSNPSGATVLINGETVGTTPLEGLSIDAGSYQLSLQAARYLPLEQPLKITGRQVQQRLSPVMEPAWADISVQSTPAGATVLIDDVPAGTTPGDIEVLQGERILSLRLPGYADWSTTLAVVAGEPQELEPVTLVPAAGVLSITSVPSGANVNVDGAFAGQTPLELELTPDREHRISLSRAGYQRLTRTRNFAAGERGEERLSLKPLLGDVVLNVEPANAQLRVNGELVGTGSRTLSLPAIQQRLELSLEGYETVRRSVTPRPGLEQLVEITLLTPQAARKARLTPTLTTAAGQTMLLMNPVDSPLNEFSMGASRRDPGRRANEVLHPVRLERPFYIQTNEVTNAQFRLFQASHNSGQLEGNSLNREYQPVAQVSWQQAAAFCNWLSRREGLKPFYKEQQGIIVGFAPGARGYRLPTEAEWSWVARVDGESLRRFTWGEEFPPKTVVENVADNSSAYVTGRILNGYDDGYVVSAPVGSFAANHRGLTDIGGNVSEWIHDVYVIPASSGAMAVDPLGAQRGDNYVIRGASWALGRLPELRLSYRDYGQAGRDDVGFRIARYAE